MPMNAKKCKVLLQVLKKSPYSIFFRFPVDPIRDGLPTYLDEIKEPMDLSSMEKKINQAAYDTMGEFAADMDLIFANCRQFNPPGTEPCQHADELEKVWRKEWAKTVTPRLEANEKRALVALVNRLKESIDLLGDVRTTVHEDELGDPIGVVDSEINPDHCSH